MSKDGPPADSFVNPQRTGWLTKLGGSGMGANWRKRWFVLDHHYIFYYKQKNDKKPVGVICLADYKLCRKAEQKECKKTNAFILEMGDLVDDLDYPVRNYVIYADTESDMTQWINDINVEIQPTSGRRAPTKEQVIVDDKAFDEVSTTATENPKLIHPTAARPRVKGRRPPRRYIPYHEDDSKEDSGDSSTASQSRTSPTAQPRQSPPTEPKSPSIPKKPKILSTSPSLRKPYKVDGGSPGSIKKKPMAPKNKPVLPREDSKTVCAPGSPQARDEEGIKPKTAPAPLTAKPKLPLAPLKQPKKSVDGITEEKSTSPSVHKKPLLSEEPNSSGSGAEFPEKILNGDGLAGVDSIAHQPSPEHKEASALRPVPRPKPRKPWDVPVRSPSPTDQVTPTKTNKPRPIPRTRTAVPNKPAKSGDEVVSESTGKESSEEERTKELPVSDDNDIIMVAYQQTSPSDTTDIEPQPSVRRKEGKKEPASALRQISYQNVTVNIKDGGEVTLSAPLPDSVSTKESQMNPAPVNDKPSDVPKEPAKNTSPSKGGTDLEHTPLDASPPKGGTEKYSQDESSQKKHDNDSNAVRPVVTPTSPGRPGQKNKLVNHRNQTPEHKPSVPGATEEEEHYVEVDVPGVQARPSSPDAGTYDIPRPSKSPDPDLGSPSPPDDSSYDIPRPLNLDLLSQEKQKPLDASKMSSSPLSSAQSEREMAPASSLDQGVPPSVGPGKRENGIGANGDDGEGQHNESAPALVNHYGPSPRRDPWGYAIVNKDSANSFHVAPAEPEDWLAKHLQTTTESGNVSESVQKARELLRQARIIKAQAEEMSKEACRELELARRERHDAAIMKKNAAEILRIAKQKLKSNEK